MCRGAHDRGQRASDPPRTQHPQAARPDPKARPDGARTGLGSAPRYSSPPCRTGLLMAGSRPPSPRGVCAPVTDIALGTGGSRSGEPGADWHLRPCRPWSDRPGRLSCPPSPRAQPRPPHSSRPPRPSPQASGLGADRATPGPSSPREGAPRGVCPAHEGRAGFRAAPAPGKQRSGTTARASRDLRTPRPGREARDTHTPHEGTRARAAGRSQHKPAGYSGPAASILRRARPSGKPSPSPAERRSGCDR